MPKKKQTTLLIKVTQACIEAAEADREAYPRSRLCPVARALQAAGFPFASSSSNEAVLHRYADSSVKLPSEVRAFIHAFDAGESVKPFTFSLSITPEAWASRTPPKPKAGARA